MHFSPVLGCCWPAWHQPTLHRPEPSYLATIFAHLCTMKKDVSIDDFKVIGLVHNPLIYLITTAKCILAYRPTGLLCLKVLAVVSNTSCVWCRLHSGLRRRGHQLFSICQDYWFCCLQTRRARQGQDKLNSVSEKNKIWLSSSWCHKPAPAPCLLTWPQPTGRWGAEGLSILLYHCHWCWCCGCCCYWSWPGVYAGCCLAVSCSYSVSG